jgi:hypothetical protein
MLRLKNRYIRAREHASLPGEQLVETGLLLNLPKEVVLMTQTVDLHIVAKALLTHLFFVLVVRLEEHQPTEGFEATSTAYSSPK